jgi:NADPH:quinone reductase-like Zn-dependent oxidoreductase
VAGAPGGVGSFTVQLLASRGARVVASGPVGDTAYLSGLGATDVVGREDFVATVRKLHRCTEPPTRPSSGRSGSKVRT